jgi:hypothetical protein
MIVVNRGRDVADIAPDHGGGASSRGALIAKVTNSVASARRAVAESGESGWRRGIGRQRSALVAQGGGTDHVQPPDQSGQRGVHDALVAGHQPLYLLGKPPHG